MMNEQELKAHVERETKRFRELVNHWCPDFAMRDGESFEQQMMRAFLAVTACASTQAQLLRKIDDRIALDETIYRSGIGDHIERFKRGLIAPLDLFPDPMFGFDVPFDPADDVPRTDEQAKQTIAHKFADDPANSTGAKVDVLVRVYEGKRATGMPIFHAYMQTIKSYPGQRTPDTVDAPTG